MQWEVSVFTSHRIPRKSYRTRWENPSVFLARCRMTQPWHWKGWEVITCSCLLAQCSVRSAMGQLVPWAGLWKSSLCATAAPKIRLFFFISMSREQGQGGMEVTFVIMLFSWWTQSAHLGVWTYMAKSLLILSWFKRCKIPRVEKHLDLHLETNKNQIRLVPSCKKAIIQHKNPGCCRSFSWLKCWRQWLSSSMHCMDSSWTDWKM